MATKKKVVVAMSGGVDSSVTAGLLMEEGYEVTGVSLRLWDCHREEPQNCSDYLGARTVAGILGIPHALLDLRPQFFETVVKPFAQGYLQGRTPNPCVACNRDFKLGVLLEWAKEQGMDYVATGHYARTLHDPSTSHTSLLRGLDYKKDQSYFLFSLRQEQLAHTLFPLGQMDKAEVRCKARRLGLPVADRPESQDVCFGDYKVLVESLAQTEDFGPGEIVDRAGNVLGRHQGIHNFTVGQRKGLGLSAPYPMYVLEIDESTKRVIVGKREELQCTGLIVGSINWIEPPRERAILAEVRVRYRSPAVPCLVRVDEARSCEIFFQEGFPAVTPGQAAVLYRGDQVLGGGWIERALRA